MTNTNTTAKENTAIGTAEDIRENISFLRMFKVLARLATLGMDVSLDATDDAYFIDGSMYDSGLEFVILLGKDDDFDEPICYATNAEAEDIDDTILDIFENLIANIIEDADEEMAEELDTFGIK